MLKKENPGQNGEDFYASAFKCPAGHSWNGAKQQLGERLRDFWVLV